MAKDGSPRCQAAGKKRCTRRAVRGRRETEVALSACGCSRDGGNRLGGRSDGGWVDAGVGRGDSYREADTTGAADQFRGPVGQLGLVLIRIDNRANAKDQVLLLAKFIQLGKHLQSSRTWPVAQVFGQGLGGDTQCLHLVSPNLKIAPRSIEKSGGLLKLSVPTVQCQGDTRGDGADAKRVRASRQQLARQGQACRQQK